MFLCSVLDEDSAMRAIKYTIIYMFTALAILGCGRGTSEKRLTHDEVRAINERVLERAMPANC